MAAGGAPRGRPLRIATRGSPLALFQAELVARLLAERAGTAAEVVVVETAGDRRQEVPLHQLGGQGVFVKEVEAAVLDGRADLAVHSAKDLPSSPEAGGDVLALVAVPERADPRDGLVGRSLDRLGPGAVVATGSVRRRAQLASLRPDLSFCELRGNIATRLAKVPPGGAVVMAVAALDRLGLSGELAEALPTSAMLPQVGQGAIAVCARHGDEETARLVAPIDDGPSRRCVEAERAFLRSVGGGCDLPIGAHATLAGDGLLLEAMVASLDGHVCVRERSTGDDPDALGATVASLLLEGAGGRSLLDAAAGRA